MDGYTKLVYNFDIFLDRLKLWITKNNYTREEAAKKIGVSSSLFRYWFNGGIISISTYSQIYINLDKYDLFA
ncbi:helix-turn-helix domain-containing protein [Romboutsia weinsteinii]|nr:helix-turn-helix transcriptional regulator [Romboutsia weinsteinii]